LGEEKEDTGTEDFASKWRGEGAGPPPGIEYHSRSLRQWRNGVNISEGHGRKELCRLREGIQKQHWRREEEK